MVQGQFAPTANLTNPFPAGVNQPRGNSPGVLEGYGTNIEFIDQDKKASYVQQHRLVNRELQAVSRLASSTTARPGATSVSAAPTTASSTSISWTRGILRSARRR